MRPDDPPPSRAVGPVRGLAGTGRGRAAAGLRPALPAAHHDGGDVRHGRAHRRHPGCPARGGRGHCRARWPGPEPVWAAPQPPGVAAARRGRPLGSTAPAQPLPGRYFGAVPRGAGEPGGRKRHPHRPARGHSHRRGARGAGAVAGGRRRAGACPAPAALQHAGLPRQHRLPELQPVGAGSAGRGDGTGRRRPRAGRAQRDARLAAAQRLPPRTAAHRLGQAAGRAPVRRQRGGHRPPGQRAHFRQLFGGDGRIGVRFPAPPWRAGARVEHSPPRRRGPRARPVVPVAPRTPR